MPDPQVSVVIPTHRRRESLRRVIDSFRGQTAPPDLFEIVVSVDGSDDGTVAMLESLETPFSLRWIEGEQRGRAGACNAAIAKATGEILIILDDDMDAAPQLVERHRGHHPSGSRACVMGAVPVELTAESSHAARYVKEKFDAHLARLADPAHRARPRSVFTGNASLRAEVMAEVGGFDEGFGVYGNEDVELALRLRAAKVAIEYDADALAWQSYDKDLAGLQRDTFDKGGTAVLLARRHPEIFGDLRLASPRDSSRPWLTARAALLAIARRRPGFVRVPFAIAAWLERLGLWRSGLFYRAALDFAFWAGVDAELGKATGSEDLAALKKDLDRGPIDLLLHR